MKKTVVILGLLIVTAIGCSPKETPASTEPADYAETHEKLISNHENDTIQIDSTAVGGRTGFVVDSTLQNK